jgi:Domain of unknown function (DUF4340)
MRGLRSTIALLVVLIGLGAYIYFVTWKQGDSTDAASKQEKLFSALEADKIEELKVKAEKGDNTTVVKKDGAWQLTQPIAAKADDSEVSSITSGLTQASIVRVVDENPADLKEYGLATPRLEIAFKASGDKDYRKLLVGDKSPTGSDMFAKRNDEKKVFLIAAFQDSSFNKDTFSLRDKQLLKFERDKVDRVEVAAAGKNLAIAKEGSEWKLTTPVQARADFGAVEGLMGRLQSAQMKSITADDAAPADLKKYGLEKPDVTVNVNAGSARATLLVGGKAEDGTFYVRDASRPMVMTAESSLVDDLKKAADEYRRKDIFEFRAYNATRIELTRNGQAVVFEKAKGQGENPQDTWRRVSPNAANPDKDKVESLLSRLSNMRATSFADSTAKTGLDKPELTVYVKFDDGKKEERVNFGKSGDDVYASRPAEPGAAKVDATDLTEALKTLDEISK